MILRDQLSLTISRLFAFAVLGCATTVAVAWCSALAVDLHEVPDPDADSLVGNAIYTHYYVGDADRLLQLVSAMTAGTFPPDVPASELVALQHFASVATPADQQAPRCFTHRRFASWGAVRDALTRSGFEPGMSSEFFSTKGCETARQETVQLYCRWFGTTPWPEPHCDQIVIEDAYGWPMWALAGAAARDQSFLNMGAIADSKVGGEHFMSVPLPMRIRSGNGFTFPDLQKDSRLLPLRPLPLGFVLNSILFGSLWCFAMFAPRSLRRSLRRRRGLCRACAYDLRATPAGSPCPECGATQSA